MNVPTGRHEATDSEEMERDMAEKKEHLQPLRPPGARCSESAGGRSAAQTAERRPATRQHILDEDLPEEVKRDIAFATAVFALLDGALKLQTALTGREITPNVGSTAGTTEVAIRGTNFIPLPGPSPATVFFGGTAASTVAVVNATEIKTTAPAHAAGTVDVDVTTLGGTTRLRGALQYQ